MTKNRKPRRSKKIGQRKSNRPLPAKKYKADFVPQEIDETAEFDGQCIGIIGGVRPPAKSKAAFEPMEIDETTPGESMGIVGVSIPPKKTTRRKAEF
jgi:hypothetical protein